MPKPTRIPTLAELQQKFPEKSPEEITAAWDTKYPGFALPGSVQAPTMLQRLRNLTTSPLAMKTGGTLAGEAVGTGLAAFLAPETAGLSLLGVPVARSVGGALGNATGDIASRFLNNRPAASGGELSLDAAEGALGTYGGKILGGLSKGAKFVGEHIPWNAGFWSPATAAVKAGAHIAEPIFGATGRAVQALNDAVSGFGERMMRPAVRDAAEERAMQTVRAAKAEQAARARMAGAKDVPYRMEGEVTTPYTPTPKASVPPNPAQTQAEFEQFGSFDPHQTPQNFTTPGITRTEHLADFSPEYNSAMAALKNATTNRGLTSNATERLMATHTPGWQDVSLEGLTSTAPTSTTAPALSDRLARDVGFLKQLRNRVSGPERAAAETRKIGGRIPEMTRAEADRISGVIRRINPTLR